MVAKLLRNTTGLAFSVNCAIPMRKSRICQKQESSVENVLVEMSGEQRIDASRARVWAALNNPAVLKDCIPGCQSLTQTAPDKMTAVAAIKVGPIGARFRGEVTLSELDPPNSYRIDGEGQGGVAGFAKGGARVSLREDGPDATILSYDVTAQVGGRLAQVGGALIDATAKQMAGSFFRKFGQAVCAELPEAAPVEQVAMEAQASSEAPAAPASAPPHAQPGQPSRRGAFLWLLAALAVGYVFGRNGGSAGNSLESWQALATGLLVTLAGVLGYGAGRDRTAAAPVVVVDAALLASLQGPKP